MDIPFREKFLLIYPAEERVEVGLGQLWPQRLNKNQEQNRKFQWEVRQPLQLAWLELTKALRL